MSMLSRLKALLWTSRDDDLMTSRVGLQRMVPAGVVVDSDTALKNATVWACIRYLSSTVAQLPWRVMQHMGEGAPRHVPLHPVARLLQQRPNPEMTAFAFRETLTGWAARYGNGVAEIITDNRNVPIEMWPLHPTRVDFKRSTETGRLVFEVTENDGFKRYLDGSRVLHIRGFGEGVVGLDVITYAAESIGWARATEVFGSAFFGNGAEPGGILKYKGGRLSAFAKEEAEKDHARKFGGPRKGGRIMVMDGQWDYTRLGSEPNAAQFIETRQHQVEEICRWFGVPPHKVMHLLRSTFTNIEHQSIEVVVDAITPWALRFEQEGDYKLFGANRQGFFTKLDLKGLLRGDYKSRQEGLQIMRRNGVINADQWALLEDMNPPGPANGGDKYIVEGNMTTLEAVGEQPPAPQLPAVEQQEESPEENADSPVVRARQQMARALLH